MDDDWSDVKVESINMNAKPPSVCLSNGYKFTHRMWYEHFVNFWDHRIVGKAIVPIFYEYLFAKGGSNAHEQLMKGMRHEGFLLGSMNKTLTPKQTIALVTIVTMIIVGMIVFIVLKNQGMLPGF